MLALAVLSGTFFSFCGFDDDIPAYIHVMQLAISLVFWYQNVFERSYKASLSSLYGKATAKSFT